MDQSLILGQDIELIWAVWFIKIFDISISQEYALKILRSHNELAMIIMFDILRWSGLNEKPAIKKEYKAILNMLKQEDVDEDGNADHLPWSSHWMLAYELERQDVFSCISETLGIMSNNPYFKKLLKKNIKFYERAISDIDNWGSNLLELVAQINNSLFHSSIYWIEPKVFVQKIHDSNNGELNQFRRTLQRYYDGDILYNRMADDIGNLKKLKQLLKKVDKSSVGQIQWQYYNWIIGDIDRYLKHLAPLVEVKNE